MNMECANVIDLARLLRVRGLLRRRRGFAPLVAFAVLLAGCSGNAHIDIANNQSADPATIDDSTMGDASIDEMSARVGFGRSGIVTSSQVRP